RIRVKAKELALVNHYASVPAISQVANDPTIAFDELDFFVNDARGNAISLPTQTLAGVKFRQLPDGLQAFFFQAAQPIAAAYVQARVKSADGSLEHELSGSPFKLSEGSNRLPYGGINFVNDVQISGWAVDPDTLPKPISVDIYVDGVYVQRIPADKTFMALQP